MPQASGCGLHRPPLCMPCLRRKISCCEAEFNFLDPKPSSITSDPQPGQTREETRKSIVSNSHGGKRGPLTSPNWLFLPRMRHPFPFCRYRGPLPRGKWSGRYGSGAPPSTLSRADFNLQVSLRTLNRFRQPRRAQKA